MTKKFFLMKSIMDPSLLTKGVLELVGTFILVVVILAVTAKPDVLAVLAIGVALMVSIWIGGAKSGSHVNPVVSLAMWLKNSTTFPASTFAVYVVFQTVGAALAYYFYQAFLV